MSEELFFSGKDVERLARKAREGVDNPNLTYQDAALLLLAFWKLCEFIDEEEADDA